MSKIDELSQMAAVVTAKYEHEQRRFAQLIAKENELRNGIKRLDDMRRATHAPKADVAQMQAIGADVIWLSWVGRSKAALNIQLAQVLAQKEHYQAAVRHAYGRVLVIDEMRDNALRNADAKTAKAQLERAISISDLTFHLMEISHRLSA